MCWSVQPLAAPVRAMWTATVTHTAGNATYITVLYFCKSIFVFKCVYFCRWKCHPQGVYLIAYLFMYAGQDECASPWQCGADLHGQQHALLLIFVFFLFSLSGCPIAAAEKLSKGHDKPHLSQPGSESLKGCPNDRVLRWEIQKVSSYIFVTFIFYYVW